MAESVRKATDEDEVRWLRRVRWSLVGLGVMQGMMFNPMSLGSILLGLMGRLGGRMEMAFAGTLAAGQLLVFLSWSRTSLTNGGLFGWGGLVGSRIGFAVCMMAAVVLASIVLYGVFRLDELLAMRERWQKVNCEKCGYDLRASRVTCPECGWAVSEETRMALEREYPPLREKRA